MAEPVATDELIAELRAGLEGVTPGPWSVEYGEIGKGPDSHPYALLMAEDEVCTGIETGDVHCIEGSRIMEHIARCSPGNIRALLARLEQAEARQVDETAWLVELGGATPSWWSLTLDEEPGWERDVNKALRFARKEDADAYIYDTGWTDAFASEHIWTGPLKQKGGESHD